MCGPFSVKMLREKTSNSIPVHFELECYPSNTVSNFDFLKQQLRLKELPAKHWRSQSSRRLRRCSDILPPSLSFCCWSLFLLVLRYMSKWLCLGFVFRHCFYSSSGVLIWEEQQRKEPSRTSFISHSWFQSRRGASTKVCLLPDHQGADVVQGLSCVGLISKEAGTMLDRFTSMEPRETPGSPPGC